MKKIRILDISFENEIMPWEVPAFRGAVIEVAGRKNVLFHNHLGKDYRFSYPLIQYKRINKKPHLICIEDGVDEAHNFFENKQEGLMLGQRNYELVVENLRLNKFTLQVWDKMFDYSLLEWLPLNQENYRKYDSLQTMTEKIEMLKSILVGNIISFAKGVGWTIDKEIKLDITNIVGIRKQKVKEVFRDLFTVEFSTNVFLPANIGLGKNSSLGFGTVREKRNSNRDDFKNADTLQK